MAKFFKDDCRIIYEKKAVSIGVPSLEDTEAIAFRLHIIWSELGHDVFDKVFLLYDEKQQNRENFNLNLELEKYEINEIDIFYCYLASVSSCIKNDLEKARNIFRIDEIFPLDNILYNLRASIDKDDEGAYYIEYLDGLMFSVPDFVRAKLALFELLFLFTGKREFAEELLYFSKNYVGDKKIKELVFETDLVLNLSPWEKKTTGKLKEIIAYLNYPFLYNAVVEDKKNKTKLVVEKIGFKFDVNEQPKKVVYSILKQKGLISESFESFEKKQQRYDSALGITRTKGRKKKEYRENEYAHKGLNSHHPEATKAFNFCHEIEKYFLIRKCDYSKCFDSYLDEQYTKGEEIFPQKLAVLLNISIS